MLVTLKLLPQDGWPSLGACHSHSFAICSRHELVLPPLTFLRISAPCSTYTSTTREEATWTTLLTHWNFLQVHSITQRWGNGIGSHRSWKKSPHCHFSKNDYGRSKWVILWIFFYGYCSRKLTNGIDFTDLAWFLICCFYLQCILFIGAKCGLVYIPPRKICFLGFSKELQEFWYNFLNWI